MLEYMWGKIRQRFDSLMANSRFWILATNIVLSVNIAGFIQLEIPSGPLQTIRIEQTYAFLSLIFLYLALLASPLTICFPKLGFKQTYIHARRAIGVSAFYFAFLHVYISFFQQLSGFTGLKYLDHKYAESLFFGAVALGILAIMAATSFDWITDKLGYRNWKRLHRLVYLAGIGIIIHVIVIGPHYNNLNPVSFISAIALLLLLGLETRRVQIAWRRYRKPKVRASSP